MLAVSIRIKLSRNLEIKPRNALNITATLNRLPFRIGVSPVVVIFTRADKKENRSLGRDIHFGHKRIQL